MTTKTLKRKIANKLQSDNWNGTDYGALKILKYTVCYKKNWETYKANKEYFKAYTASK